MTEKSMDFNQIKVIIFAFLYKLELITSNKRELMIELIFYFQDNNTQYKWPIN